MVMVMVMASGLVGGFWIMNQAQETIEPGGQSKKL